MSVESPCNRTCKYSRELGFCQGCGRTLEDIKHYGQATDQEKERIRLASSSRLQTLNPALS